MKVLLIYPRAARDISDIADMGALSEPLALEYLATGARMDGHDARILDLRLHFEEFEDTLRQYRPDVVGVTGYSMHVLRCLDILQKAKQELPTCVTVVGGHHATLEPIDFLEPQVDYVVRGEGTGPFREILSEVSSGLRPGSTAIAGVFSKEEDGTFKDGGPPRQFDIKDIPWPDRTLAVEDRQKYHIDWMSPVALARTSVGCPYRCSFCALWRMTDGRYYTREVQRVADELATIPETYVMLVDDEAFVNKRRMSELAEMIAKAGVEKKYFAYCRLDTLTREGDLIKQWRDIGLKRLMIGVETVFDWELKQYNKRQTHDSILRGLEAAERVGVRLLCNFVVNPSYTDREFDALIRFIQSNGLEHPSFTVWTPIPATVDYRFTDITELQPNGRPNWDYFDLNHAVTPTKMPKETFQARYLDLYRRFPRDITPEQERKFRGLRPRSQAADLARRVLSLASQQRPSQPSTSI